MKIINTEEEHHLKDLRNFNEIFRKDVTYDNIKSHRKTWASPSLSLKNTFLEKPPGVESGQIDLPPAFSGIKIH